MPSLQQQFRAAETKAASLKDLMKEAHWNTSVLESLYLQAQEAVEKAEEEERAGAEAALAEVDARWEDSKNVVADLWTQFTEAMREVDGGEEDEEVYDLVTSKGKTTITLGALIDQLNKLKETLGHNAPVWHIEFGGITATNGAEECEGGVAIE